MSSDEEELARVKRRRILEPSPTPSESSTPSPSPSASPSPEPDPNAANPFLSLPVEIMDRILSFLPDFPSNSRLGLVQTATSLHRRYRLQFVLDYLQSRRDPYQVYYLDDARKGDLGWYPFCITGAVKADSDYLDDVLVTYFDWNLEEFHPNRETRDYLPLEVTTSRVRIDPEHISWFERNSGRRQVAEWNQLRGRIVKATPGLFRSRFKCPECRGSGRFAYDRPSYRWPSMPSALVTCIGPCPRCTISYEGARAYVESVIVDHLADEEDLYKEFFAEMLDGWM